MVDAQRLQDSWNRVAALGDEVPLFFYSWLFLRFPETGSLFPPSMAAQRDRLVSALGRIVADVENLPSLAAFLAQLGRDHRKFGIEPEHYLMVGEALLATLEHFLGRDWTAELAADWAAAYELIAQAMNDAAQEAARSTPAWWDAEIVNHELRGPDIAVITVRTALALDFQPGQSVAVQTGLHPRLWRYYSPANAPRPDNTIEFHVRAAHGGWVSPVLVHDLGPGDLLRFGAPVGEQLTLSRLDHTTAGLLLVAGGTGLAPLRALVDQLARLERAGQPAPPVHLFVGARTATDLYDWPALASLAGRHRWLTVVPVVSDDAGYDGPAYDGLRGQVGQVAAARGAWSGHEVYVCGPPAMVQATRADLVNVGVDPGRIRHETFTGRRHRRADDTVHDHTEPADHGVQGGEPR